LIEKLLNPKSNDEFPVKPTSNLFGCNDFFDATRRCFVLVKRILRLLFLKTFINKLDSSLHSPTKKDIVSFRELDSTILDRFFAANYESVLEFFPARQDFEIIGLLSVKNGLYCKIL
jgi:hypothetical protein